MTARGWSLPEAPVVTVILEARPDGTVHHLDAPTLNGAGYAGYRTAMTWIAEEAAPLLMAGPFTPEAGAGTYRLARLGDTVTATLAFPPVDGLTAGSAHLFTVPAGFRPVEAVTWTVPATAQVPVGGGDDSEAARGSALELQVHRDGRVTQADRPRQAGHVATVTWRTADPGWMEARGTYVPTGGEGTGTYSLRRDGMLVTATVTGAHGVPPASVLFTVPAGFRPAQTVHRSMVVDAAGCHTRMLEVRPKGTVHLVGQPVGTGTEPLVHETVMAWTAGADVCQRHPWVQARLLQALRSQGFVRDSCAEVTWTDLTSVKSLDLKPAAALRAWLEGTPPLQAHDLSGLTGLKTLALQGDVWFPAVPVDLLVHAPALESLDLSGPLLRLPPGFLAHAPGLRRLTLRDTDPAALSFLPPGLEVLDLEVPAEWTELPPDLLAHVPELQRLTLKGTGLTMLPADLLARVPKLQRLTLEVPELRTLPPDLLARVPELQDLTLEAPELTMLPPDLLAGGPELRYLTLKVARLTELPAGLLVTTPYLRKLRLEAARLTELPANLLAATSYLGNLYLEAAGLTELPANLLAATPELAFLTLKVAGLTELPTDFLAPTPRLRFLTLEASELTALPTDFLGSVPVLFGLSLEVARLTELPEDLLVPIPELDHLTLKVAGLTELPADLLVSTAVKEALTVQAPSLTALPADFLSSLSELRDLTLEIPASRTPLPPNLLAATPGLHSLTLEIPVSQAVLPPDLLVHVPELRKLTLKAAGLTELPANFLVHTPHLRCLILETMELPALSVELQARLHEIQDRQACT